MTENEQAVLSALVELEDAASAVKTGGARPDLGAILAKLDRLTETLPAETDSRLRHYLERKSYHNARLHLEAGSELPRRGSCG